MSLAGKNLIILLLILIITIIPFIIKPDAEFVGADGTAGELITKINPNYKSWFNHIWEPPSGEIESLLFALQAALGAGFLGYYIGSKRTEAKYEEEMEQSEKC